jgi:3-isopropylmalate/(R)-2-methylmalate dehydratase small subunit
MAGWTRHDGLAVALPLESIDTDQLIPARFMSTPRDEGYGRFLLHDQRIDVNADPVADHPLNRHKGISVIVTRRNFGSGSSREAAVYALHDFGIRVVIAPSFGDIFAANAVNNGLLPAQVSEDEVETLIAALGDGTAPASVDLEVGYGRVGDHAFTFALEPIWRRKLMMGWDDIDLTRSHTAEIDAFRTNRKRSAPWIQPSTGAS